jgi:hypothetical protein
VTDIFEEVDQSLREDRLAKAWKKWSLWVYAAIALAIAGVGAYEFWKWQTAETIEKDARVFDTAMAALDRQDLAAAKSTFQQLGQGEGGFAGLANHMLARIEKELTNDNAAVAQAFAKAAERDNSVLADIATLKLAYARADTADLAEIERILAPLIAKGGQAAALGRELVAAKALATGDIERARTEYQSLAFEIDAPRQMQLRVSQTLATLPPKPAAPAAAAPAEAAPPPAGPPAQPSTQPPAQAGQQ